MQWQASGDNMTCLLKMSNYSLYPDRSEIYSDALVVEYVKRYLKVKHLIDGIILQDVCNDTAVWYISHNPYDPWGDKEYIRFSKFQLLVHEAEAKLPRKPVASESGLHEADKKVKS